MIKAVSTMKAYIPISINPEKLLINIPTEVAPLATARNKISINIKTIIVAFSRPYFIITGIVIEIYMNAEKSMASWTIVVSKLI